MDQECERLRRRIEEVRRLHPPHRKGWDMRGYTARMRALRGPIEEYYTRRRLEGAAWGKIAQELGLAPSTFFRWAGLEKSPWERAREVFYPVEVAERVLTLNEVRESVGSVLLPTPCSEKNSATGQELQRHADGAVLLLPGGLRVEGIELSELPALLGRTK